MQRAELNMPFHPSDSEVRVIRSNFDQFRELVERAGTLLKKGRHDEAALHAEIAALFAVLRHCGLFVSSELERILITMGKELQAGRPRSDRIRPGADTPRTILHVATSVMGLGGHSRMLLRWIRQDAGRTHSVALTRQLTNPIPGALGAAVTRTGGRLYRVNEKRGGLLSWAQELREIAASADLIVLHIFNYDVLPLIAFADRTDLPPVVLLDHADHTFWLGASISDLVIALRESGRRLAQQRRYIAPERSVLLPIILEPNERVLTRAEAKRQLGLPENSVLLLSVARALKYRTMHGDTDYADAHVPILEKHGQAILMVVGPGARDDWRSATERTQGRIISLPEQENVSIFQQAADIYVDSFPFVSITSLLEAGSYGVPLVSRDPYSARSEILGADTPGLTGTLLRAKTSDEYAAALSHLIEDPQYRRHIGDATRTKILNTHTGPIWQHSLEEIYRLSMHACKGDIALAEEDQMLDGEPDIFLPRVHGLTADVMEETLKKIRSLPARERLSQWRELTGGKGADRISIIASTRFLFPEWLACRIFQRFPPARWAFRHPSAVMSRLYYARPGFGSRDSAFQN
jgi:glycosyltransferase involved in cell wall biosynthesis